MTLPLAKPRVRIAAGLLACAMTLAAQPARAWRAYHTSTGAQMRWSAKVLQQPIAYGIDASGLAADGIAPGAVAAAVQSGFAQWQGLTCPGCSTQAAALLCGESGCLDRQLGVTFAGLGWQPAQPIGLGCSATKGGVCLAHEPDGNQVTFVHDDKDWNFGNQVIAMTVVSAKADTGFIADADIAVNDAGFPFCLDACGPGQVHLGAVILHEAGHFIGLDHSDVAAAIMYAKPPATIDQLGTLQADDRAGACAAYPSETTATTCAPVRVPESAARADEGGCSGSRAGSGAVPCLFLVSALVLGRRARRSGVGGR